MEKHILFLAMAAVALSCQRTEMDVRPGQAGELFSLEAEIVATKTSLTVADKVYKVAWDDDDALSVVAVYDDGTSAGYEFEKGDGNTFSCSGVTAPEKIRSLDIFYPYVQGCDALDAGGYSSAAFVLGSAAGEPQHQDGTDMTGHVDAPLYGCSEAGLPVSMKHASTLLDVTVTNARDEDIAISEILIGNGYGYPMTGEFHINPQTGSLKEGQSVSSSASLRITDGTLAAGGTGHFYLTSAPFSLSEGQSLDITVVASDDTRYEILKTVDRDVDFRPGTVNHINISVTDGGETPARIFVDFGKVSSGDAKWNTCDTRGGDGPVVLKDENGMETGVSIDLSGWPDDFDNYAYNLAAPFSCEGIEFPVAVFQDALYIYDDEQAYTFTLSGLDPDVTYSFLSVSMRLNGGKDARETMITMSGAQTSGTEHVLTGVKVGTGEDCIAADWDSVPFEDYCRTFTLRPAPDGTVSVTLQAVMRTVAQAHLNALVITPVQ